MSRLPTEAGFLLLFALFLPSFLVQTAQHPNTITVSGTLVRVAGIGGETTGWAIQLDSQIEVQGEQLNSIEVSGDRSEFAMLENKHVEATGKIAARHGVTRGEWPVLEVSSIRESRRKP